MSLPIDRTTKAALDTNLVNGNTSDAPAIKNSNDVVYNTIDELNAKVDGLVTTGTLSQASVTPVANKIAQRDANGNVVNAYPVANSTNPNLAFNPSWTLGQNGWTGVGALGFSLTTGNNGDGNYLFKNTSASATVTSVTIPVGPSVPLTLSGDIYTLGVTAGGVQLFIDCLNNVGAVINQQIINATIGTGWQKYVLSFVTPANTASIRVNCQIPNGSTLNTNGAGWRKIKVEAGTFFTTYSDDNTLNTQQYGSSLGLTQVLSGGYKEENGIANITTSAAIGTYSVSVTFPTAFGAIPQVFVSSESSAPEVVSAATTSNRTATGFTAYVRQTDAVVRTVPISWMAKGT